MMRIQTPAMTAKMSMPKLPRATTAEMTMAMMPAALMVRTDGKSVRRYKRKDKFGECGEGKLQFNGDYLLHKKCIPNLTSASSLAKKREQTFPHASWEYFCTISTMISTCLQPNRRGD